VGREARESEGSVKRGGFKTCIKERGDGEAIHKTEKQTDVQEGRRGVTRVVPKFRSQGLKKGVWKEGKRGNPPQRARVNLRSSCPGLNAYPKGELLYREGGPLAREDFSVKGGDQVSHRESRGQSSRNRRGSALQRTEQEISGKKMASSGGGARYHLSGGPRKCLY